MTHSFIAHGAIAFKAATASRSEILLDAATTGLQVFLTATIWARVTGDFRSAGAVATAALLVRCLTPWRFSGLPNSIRSGALNYEMARRLSITSQSLAQGLGNLLSSWPRLVTGVLSIAFAAHLDGNAAVNFPESLGHWGVAIALLPLGAVLSMAANNLVGQLAYWTTETTGPFMVYRMTALVLAGGLVPLSALPHAFVESPWANPFRLQTAGAYAAWSDVRPWDLLETLAGQAIWIAVLLLGATALEVRGRRRIEKWNG